VLSVSSGGIHDPVGSADEVLMYEKMCVITGVVVLGSGGSVVIDVSSDGDGVSISKHDGLHFEYRAGCAEVRTSNEVKVRSLMATAVQSGAG
jgi:hypothetical protein